MTFDYMRNVAIFLMLAMTLAFLGSIARSLSTIAADQTDMANSLFALRKCYGPEMKDWPLKGSGCPSVKEGGSQ